MRYGVTIALLLLTSGLPLMPTGPLLADDGASSARSDCNDRLSYIAQRLEHADPIARREAQIRQIVDGARSLGRLGNEERCAELPTNSTAC